MPGTKLKILDLSISDLPNVFIVKAARSLSKTWCGLQKIHFFPFGNKNLTGTHSDFDKLGTNLVYE